MQDNLRIKKRAKMIQALAALNYGSEKTIGPRQVAVICDILQMNIRNINCTQKRLQTNHPNASLATVLFTLQTRGLIKMRPVKGRGYEVTASGLDIAMSVHNSKISAGLGVVATGVRKKK
jgi:hypothetical protein